MGIVTPTEPYWLIYFFRGVETTNQTMFFFQFHDGSPAANGCRPEDFLVTAISANPMPEGNVCHQARHLSQSMLSTPLVSLMMISKYIKYILIGVNEYNIKNILNHVDWLYPNMTLWSLSPTLVFPFPYDFGRFQADFKQRMAELDDQLKAGQQLVLWRVEDQPRLCLG